MANWYAVGSDLQAMQDRMARMDRQRPVTGTVPPLPTRYPALTRLTPDQVAHLTCHGCSGRGTAAATADTADSTETPVRWPCRTCGGTGLHCPACRGMRWVRTSAPAKDAGAVDTLVARCAACLTVEREIAAIVEWIAAPPPPPPPRPAPTLHPTPPPVVPVPTVPPADWLRPDATVALRVAAQIGGDR